MVLTRPLLGALGAALLAACSQPGTSGVPGGSSPPPTAASSATPTATATAIPAAPTPTAPPPPPDIWAAHLRVPSIGIDAVVQESAVVPVAGGASPACISAPATGPSPEPAPTAPADRSPPAPAAETFSVPPEGIATPRDEFDFLHNRSWIFGHSRWLGVPGLFSVLDRIERGDVVYVDGVDRSTGRPVTAARFVVTGIYLSDTSSGAALVAGDRIGARARPLVILQTSVRESGPNRPWILDRERVLHKAVNVVEGDLDDPCRYLLLFVVAEYAP